MARAKLFSGDVQAAAVRMLRAFRMDSPRRCRFAPIRCAQESVRYRDHNKGPRIVNMPGTSRL